MTLTEPRIQSSIAPDLYGTAWLNGEPYAIRRGDGDVVLVDFWSSTCVHCLSDLQQINAWQRSYADAGLVVVGVHAPEYEFAASTEHVARTINDHSISYRVVLDNMGSLRASYGVEHLPTKALVDRNGIVRYILNGRTDYLEFERAIQHLLKESGYHGELPSLFETLENLSPARDEADLELRCGYLRGSLGNIEGYASESVQLYRDPGTVLPGRVFLHGAWFSGREALRALPGEGAGNAFRIVMGGGDLFIIARSMDDSPVEIELEVHGAPVSDPHLGNDLSRNSRGKTILNVSAPRAYHMLTGLPEQIHDVVLRTRKGEVEIFQVSITGAGDMRALFPN